MPRYFPFLLLCVIPLICCESPQSKTQDTLSRIGEIQDSIRSGAVEDPENRLLQLKQQLDQLPQSPDSLHAENYYLRGHEFDKRGIKDSAAIYYFNATEYINDSLYRVRQAEIYEAAWNAHATLGLYGDCLTLAQKFKSILDPDKNYRSFTYAFYWEKEAYIRLGKLDEAEEVLNEQLELVRTHDTLNLPYALNALADFQYFQKKNKKEAFKILENLLDVEQTLSDHYRAQINTGYGVYNYYEGDYSKALEYYLKALEAGKANKENANYLNALGNYYSNIGEVLIDLKNYELSRIYLDSARAVGFENLSRKRQKALMNYELRLAMATGENQQVLSNLINEVYTFQDSIYSQKSNNELLALQKANEKEKALLLENQETLIDNIQLKNRSLIIGISLGLLSVIVLLFYQRRKLRFERESLANQQRLLRSQMNPHFTFNTLYAIQNELKTDQAKAGNHLMKFSRLLRLVLENSTQNYVALETEIEALKKYIELQLVRHENKFTFDITMEEIPDPDLIFVPPMLLQPFVENSIEHGLSAITYPGRLEVRLQKQNGLIYCEIEDNGKGLVDHSGAHHKSSKSIALIADYLRKSTKKELRIMNKSQEQADAAGVVVQFFIPYKLTEHD